MSSNMVDRKSYIACTGQNWVYTSGPDFIPTHIYTRTHMHTCMCAHTHIYTRTHMHTCMCTHTHIHISSSTEPAHGSDHSYSDEWEEEEVEEEEDGGQSSDEEEQEDSKDYCKGTHTHTHTHTRAGALFWGEFWYRE